MEEWKCTAFDECVISDVHGDENWAPMQIAAMRALEKERIDPWTREVVANKSLYDGIMNSMAGVSPTQAPSGYLAQSVGREVIMSEGKDGHILLSTEVGERLQRGDDESSSSSSRPQANYRMPNKPRMRSPSPGARRWSKSAAVSRANSSSRTKTQSRQGSRSSSQTERSDPESSTPKTDAEQPADTPEAEVPQSIPEDFGPQTDGASLPPLMDLLQDPVPSHDIVEVAEPVRPAPEVAGCEDVEPSPPPENFPLEATLNLLPVISAAPEVAGLEDRSGDVPEVVEEEEHQTVHLHSPQAKVQPTIEGTREDTAHLLCQQVLHTYVVD